MAGTTSVWTRRLVLGVAVALPMLGLARAQSSAPVLIVSRKQLLNDTEAARTLLRAEIELTAELQRRVDAIKAQLTAEEEELARQRPTMGREAFDARVTEFDRKVRRERRQTQHRAAALQNAFREARLKLLDALDPVLEEVRVAHGASVILNADQALVNDPSVDVTAEVIARVNETLPTPAIPDLDSLDPGPDNPLADEPEILVPEGQAAQQ